MGIGSSLFTTLRSLVYASGFVALWAGFALWARSFDSQMPFAIPQSFELWGWGIGTVGGVLTLWTISTFILRGRGTPAPFDPPREFVATGPFLYVRNPMYIGAMGVLVGAALVLTSPAILGVTLIFGLWAHLFVRFYEEPTLDRKFGASYRDYRERVHRWRPRTPSK